MGISFRKSISLGKFARLNLSKQGLGMSVGIKGVRIGTSKRGSYSHISIPGTGLYERKYYKHKEGSSTQDKGMLGWVLVFIFTLAWLGYSPKTFLISVIILLIAYMTHYNLPAQKVKRKLVMAYKMQLEERFLESIKILSTIINTGHASTTAHLLWGTAYYYTEQHSEAIRHLKPLLVDSDLNTFELMRLVAKSYIFLECYDDSIHYLQLIITHSPDDLNSLYLLGKSFADKGDYETSISVLKQAPLLKRKLGDELLSIHYLLGLNYKNTSDKKNSLKHFKRVYAVNVNYKNVKEEVAL
jgi:tetratricopeptide (TPR) repeat protein